MPIGHLYVYFGEISVYNRSSDSFLNWVVWTCLGCFVVFQLLNHVLLFATSWTVAHQASRSFTISQSLLKLMSIESVMPSHHLSSVVPFSSCPQSFPASGSFPIPGQSQTTHKRLPGRVAYLVSDSFPHPITGFLKGAQYHSIFTPGCVTERRNPLPSGVRPGKQLDTASGSGNAKEAGL